MRVDQKNPSYEKYGGLPCIRLTLPSGDSVRVAQHGATIMNWRTADGQERLFLSKKTATDGLSAIRGGVPICFPQFAERGSMVRHGFARNMPWKMIYANVEGDVGFVAFQLATSAHTLKHWDQEFLMTLKIQLKPDEIEIELIVQNFGLNTMRFTAALHTYLAVEDITTIMLRGLKDRAYWDSVINTNLIQDEELLSIKGRLDRIYSNISTPMVVLQRNKPVIQISQSASFNDVVIWNPGDRLGNTLKDMPLEGYRKMLCVEAARINTPVQLTRGEVWQAKQTLNALG